MVPFCFTAEKELILGYRDYLPKTSVIPFFPPQASLPFTLGSFYHLRSMLHLALVTKAEAIFNSEIQQAV